MLMFYPNRQINTYDYSYVVDGGIVRFGEKLNFGDGNFTTGGDIIK